MAAISLAPPAIADSAGDRPPLPRHIAIVMDGNGRWALARGRPRHYGHRQGLKALRDLLSQIIEQGAGYIKYLTLFGFSINNWARPRREVDELFGLLKRFFVNDSLALHEKNVRIKIIGARAGIASEIREMLESAEKLTAHNDGLQLILAVNYGARDELMRAVQSACHSVYKDGEMLRDIDMTMIEDHLDTRGVPDPDLLIRTGGEQRLSDFLLWQSAYAELYFSPLFWPDFDFAAFEAAVSDYQNRERRFGGLRNVKTV